ncbi:MAG: hypothetical protein Q9195_002170 [Heterodermia aff. obscurata]
MSATEIAVSTGNEAIMCASLALLNTLIDSEEGNFLDEPAFATTVTNIATEISTSRLITSATESLLFEVLFGVAAKLRLENAHLRFWFNPGAHNAEGPGHHQRNPSRSGDVVRDFPLFYVLLDHVHRDGKVGEFARTGLLYIIESAARSDRLERWVVESDLALLMASGLGGLYSQLSRKLVMSFTQADAPQSFVFTDDNQPSPTFDTLKSSSPDFREGLSMFLNYLVFWQDILENCASDDVKQTLLDHFELLFLKQLLYPSLLESSDADGGFVAVLTYLRCILLTVHHPDLTHRILHYLLALPRKSIPNSSTSRPATLARRRKSESLIRKQAATLEEIPPGLYTLVDMIFGGLGSDTQQTVAATLRLLGTILANHHQYVIPGLIKAKAMKDNSMKRSVLAHDANIDALLGMAEALIDDDTDQDYESHLQDARVLLESHVCSPEILTLPSINLITSQNPFGDQLVDHTIDPGDRLLQSMLSLLDRFFSNEIETNLSLTQTLSCLASCGHTQLEGWLLDDLSGTTELDSNTSRSPAELESIAGTDRPKPATEGQSEDSDVDQPTGAPMKDYVSPFFKSLDALVDQVERFKQEIEDFEIYLAERKHIFKVGERMENELGDAPALSPTESRAVRAASHNKMRAPGPVVSIAERLLSNDNSTNTSRASSPRGRHGTAPSGPTLVGRLSHLQVSPSPSRSKDSSAYAASPLRRGSVSSTPSKSLPSPTGPANAIYQQIKIPICGAKRRNDFLDIGSSETSSFGSELSEPEPGRRRDFIEVSLSKILTNVVILQEFLLEMAAIVEVRASLFGEVLLG